jgi:hypothetical protein
MLGRAFRIRRVQELSLNEVVMNGVYPVVVAALTALAAAALRRVFQRTLGDAPTQPQ